MILEILFYVFIGFIFTLAFISILFPNFTDSLFLFEQESERDIKIELLIIAQERIENGDYKYICHALESQYNYEDPRDIDDCIDELIELIKDSIYPYNSIEGYLVEQHSLFLTIEERVKYRSMFIDKMIEYIADNK